MRKRTARAPAAVFVSFEAGLLMVAFF